MEIRKASIKRKTTETNIDVSVDIDGKGNAKIETGIGFLDHMLILLAKHALIDLEIKAQGDLHIDQHHTVEDIALALGTAIKNAVGNKKGIKRYGFFILPMDETLVRVAVDFSGRPWIEWRVKIDQEKIGNFDTCLAKEFMRALTAKAEINMHVDLLAGGDPHHIIEAIFKALGRAIRIALTNDEREKGIPSTKGTL